MKTSKTPVLGIFIILGLIVVTNLQRSHIPAVVHAEDRAEDRNVVGTWLVTVNVATPPDAPAFTFTDMIAFNRGGTLVATSTAFNPHTSEILPGPLGVDTSDGYGVWAPSAGAEQIGITFRRFLFAGANGAAPYGLPNTPSFLPGQNVGVNTVQAVGRLHPSPAGDTLDGQFTTQFRNLAGQVVFSGHGTFSSTRLQVQPCEPNSDCQ